MHCCNPEIVCMSFVCICEYLYVRGRGLLMTRDLLKVRAYIPEDGVAKQPFSQPAQLKLDGRAAHNRLRLHFLGARVF